MRILLTTLNSKYVHSNLAIKYLYTCVADEYSDVSVREFTINSDLNSIYMEIVKANYDMVCFSTYIWNIEEIKTLGEDLKLAKPEMKIVLGGPEVSFDAPEFVRDNTWVDFVIAGEGEYSFYRFMEVLHSQEKAFNTVPGLVYRGEGTIYVNQELEPIEFSAVPFPYHILDVEPDRVVYYESSRGCPFGCSYFLSAATHSVRTLPMDRVKAELKYFLYKEVNQVKFVDRTFNFDAKRACELVSYLIANDNGKTSFHLEICADLLTDELMALFSRARKGQFELEIGIQSTNPATLVEINRSENYAPVLNNTKKLVSMGNLHTHVDLIAGLPYESYELFKKSFNDVYSLGADAFQLGFLKVLKGTPIWGQLQKHGIEYRKHAPYEVISTDYISAEELVKLHEIENVLDIYYNRKGFERTLDFLVHIFEEEGKGGAFGLFESLAKFYYEKGFGERPRSKDDNYRIMLQFAESLGGSRFFNGAYQCLDEDARASMDELNYKRFSSKSWRIE